MSFAKKQKNKILKMALNNNKKQKKKKKCGIYCTKFQYVKNLKVCVRRCFVTLTLHTKTHSVGGS